LITVFKDVVTVGHLGWPHDLWPTWSMTR